MKENMKAKTCTISIAGDSESKMDGNVVEFHPGSSMTVSIPANRTPLTIKLLWSLVDKCYTGTVGGYKIVSKGPHKQTHGNK